MTSPSLPSLPADARTERLLNTLERVSSFISSVTDLNDLLRQIMAESERLLEAEASAVFLYDEVTDELYFEVVLGKPEVVEKLRNLRIKVRGGRGFAAECADRRASINCPDAQEDPRHNRQADKLSGFITRAVMAVPMIHKEKLVGVLEVLNHRGGTAFDGEDLRILEIIAGQAAVAIENAHLIASSIRSERLAAMGTAMAGISHGIKNILTGVRGSASLIDHALQQDPVNLGMICEAWPILKKNEALISEMIQDMLMYSKRREPDLEDGSVVELCEEIFALCLQRALDSGLELRHRWPETDRLETAFDRKAMLDCVLNLVTNAIEATPSGDESYVELSAQASDDGKGIIVRVADNGTGIPEEILKKIWEPFFSTKGKKGTGLGLAMARKTVEEHGGHISVLSVEGEGTTFTIILPRRQAPRRLANGGDEDAGEES
ncbi:MAG: GAF domain-containing sensor histidine kinase [Candidatus Sumerlaeia bacterium]|nr:GAF domain-containing sensor histidine kinase [Candidatus Sumerlaeia bacterium]